MVTAITTIILMGTEAIEWLLNKVTSNNSARENQRLTNENKRVCEQPEHHSNEQKQKNDILPAQNHQSSDQVDRQTEKSVETKEAYAIQNVQTEPLLIHLQSNEENLEATSAQLAAANIELEKQLEHYQNQHEDELIDMDKLLVQLKAKKLNSFEDIENQDKQAKETFITLAKQAKPIGMEGNNVALFGITATGKSTMLNKLYGDKVAETGIGETTVKITSYKTKDFVLWDIPGKNDEVSYMSMQYISFFKGLTRRLVLVTHTLKENSSMMKLLDAIGLDYDIVVNKMDQHDKEEQPAFREALEKEKETLGLKGVGRIFYVSAKFPQQFPDWLKMVDYIKNHS